MAHFASSPYLVIHQLTCRFADGETLFGPLNLSLDRRHCALVGRNGVGKSRLLRLLAGREPPADGHIETRGLVAWVQQQSAVEPGVTLAQWLGYGEVFAALERVARGAMLAEDVERLEGRWDLAERLQAAFAEAGLSGCHAQRPACELSGGERMRAALCGALLSGADFLLLDEPSNHLDAAGRDWLYRQLAQWRGGLLVASHDRQLLMRMQRIVELMPDGLHSYSGDYQAFCRQREQERQAARQALEHAEQERKRARARLVKEHDASQRRAAKTLREVDNLNIASFERVKYKGAAKESLGTLRRQHQQQKSALDSAVHQAQQRVEAENSVLFTLPGSALAAGKQVLTLEQLRLPFSTLPPLDWRMDGPMRVAVCGPNGCGKSTLLRTILGQLTPSGGRCRLAVNAAYLDQTLSQFDLRRSLMDHLALERMPMAAGELRTRLAQLQLGAERLTLPLAMLSGGERLKAALACALWRESPPQLLVLDEPTNHLDLASLQAIEEALHGYPGALLVVSHDEAFLQGLGLTHRLQWRPQGWLAQVL
ncbi:TPA: ABC-F family ATP-binding cassette domain-containing protein [Serratia rubidaea]|nr:ABC-F family ATP-binding cassette domain-containing protein [Serratia rubidaea]HDJ1449108.1 ABC-F family ATP-binding cassette domain-containing protein [Serratia rubidaea]HDJ1459656.1 ABC-F family ATP-binding cassette domain-containing protein [Serratia rubidaea]HDJ2772492.1 ABC-F family ATP-binding cassette domain-containing protein [Serratia rubidaea]